MALVVNMIWLPDSLHRTLHGRKLGCTVILDEERGVVGSPQATTMRQSRACVWRRVPSICLLALISWLAVIAAARNTPSRK
jgi:hypothetical protein